MKGSTTLLLSICKNRDLLAVSISERYDIAEILLKLALNTNQSINHSIDYKMVNAINIFLYLFAWLFVCVCFVYFASWNSCFTTSLSDNSFRRCEQCKGGGCTYKSNIVHLHFLDVMSQLYFKSSIKLQKRVKLNCMFSSHPAAKGWMISQK